MVDFLYLKEKRGIRAADPKCTRTGGRKSAIGKMEQKKVVRRERTKPRGIYLRV